MEEDRTEPFLADREDDKKIISRLVGWIGGAKEGEPLAAGGETAEPARPQVQVGITLKDGRTFTLEPVCTMDAAGLKTDCHEEEGRVFLYRDGDPRPRILLSPELASWINRDYRFESFKLLRTAKPRAVGASEQGELVLAPRLEERLQRLGAPSCLGKEYDYRITGAYDVLFKRADGTEQIVRSFDELTLIRPDTEPISMDKLTFGSYEAFAFMPAYADCHGLEFYLFGVRDGEAFPFAFRLDGTDRDTFETSPGRKPQVVGGKLVVESGMAAGMNTPLRYTFQPDWNARTMELIRKEEVRSQPVP
ncbi:hypothetical protein LJK88_08580 [Paenibacillus sp. P26]|nr:hypothetical protein LJK88_08580 [Paenibacillus sp. P26]